MSGDVPHRLAHEASIAEHGTLHARLLGGRVHELAIPLRPVASPDGREQVADLRNREVGRCRRVSRDRAVGVPGMVLGSTAETRANGIEGDVSMRFQQMRLSLDQAAVVAILEYRTSPRALTVEPLRIGAVDSLQHARE